MKPQQTLDFHIRWAWAKISKAYNAEAGKFGGTMSIGYVLLNIDKEGTPSTTLGPKMGMEPTSLSRTLKTMEAEGLICKKADPNDGRVVRIFLTDKGKKMRNTSKDVVLRLNEKLLGVLNESEINAFFKVMNKINETIDKQGIFDEKKD